MVHIELRLHSDFDEGLKEIASQMSKMKKSVEPFATHFAMKLLTFLPSVIA